MPALIDLATLCDECGVEAETLYPLAGAYLCERCEAQAQCALVDELIDDGTEIELDALACASGHPVHDDAPEGGQDA
jgi:hypothetical protein